MQNIMKHIISLLPVIVLLTATIASAADPKQANDYDVVVVGYGGAGACAAIEAADAVPDEMIVLSDENSLWGADVYIAVSKDVPGATMATISGTVLAAYAGMMSPFQPDAAYSR